MVGGRIVADGTPDDVFNREAVQQKVGMPVATRLARSAGLAPPWPVRQEQASAAFAKRIA
jgi:hypothetical protein